MSIEQGAKPEVPNPDWRTYRTGELDRAGRRIEKVYALDDNYVIYFSECELFYELGPKLWERDLGSTNAALARINRLLPDNPTDKNSPTYRNKFSTLELVADACEMVFCGETNEGLDILRSIQERLLTTEEGKRRLLYQVGTISITGLLWLIYLCIEALGADNQWVLAAVLAAAGGLFSVCLNLGTLQVSINQQKGFLLSAGATRSLVALLSGIGLLLAMRSKMFAGIAYSAQPPAIAAPLTIAEMFFCFLAGFSESFVPNILRDSEKKGGGDSISSSSGTQPGKGSQMPHADGDPNKSWARISERSAAPGVVQKSAAEKNGGTDLEQAGK